MYAISVKRKYAISVKRKYAISAKRKNAVSVKRKNAITVLYIFVEYAMGTLHFYPVVWGLEFSQRLPLCVCKSRLIKGYELSYATGSLNAGSSCIQWGV